MLKLVAPNAGLITDLGEKIGDARKDRAVSRGSSRAPDDSRPAWARRYAVLPSPSGRWNILDAKGNHHSKGLGWATEQEALNVLPFHAVSLAHRVRHAGSANDGSPRYEIARNLSDSSSVRVVTQEFESHEKAMQYMALHAEEILQVNTTFGESDMPLPQEVSRSGQDWRRGADVTGQDFMETFSLRGVEFGNWNNQAERQALMNVAYDSFLDLASELGIHPHDIGFRGELALAFGARGAGLSSARAHYEPERCVINLTKMKGAGALAHEWFHALDHKISRTLGISPALMKVQGDGTRKFEHHQAAAYFASNIEVGQFLSRRMHESSWNPALQPLAKAVTSLHAAMTKKTVQQPIDLDNSKRFAAGSWERVMESVSRIRVNLANPVACKKRHNQPASDDQLAFFDSLVAQTKDIAESSIEQAMTSGCIQSQGDAAVLNAAIEHFLLQASALLKEIRGTSGRNQKHEGEIDLLEAHFFNLRRCVKTLADASAGQFVAKTVNSDFMLAAKRIDHGRIESYWCVPTEMGARSLMAILRDQMAGKRQENTFLNYAPARWAMPTHWGHFPIFPEGQELKDIEAAWRHLLAQAKQCNLVAHHDWQGSSSGISHDSSDEAVEEQAQAMACA